MVIDCWYSETKSPFITDWLYLPKSNIKGLHLFAMIQVNII